MTFKTLSGFFIFCLLITVKFGTSTAFAKNDILKMDRIIAVVDQNVLTEQELADRMKTVTAS